MLRFSNNFGSSTYTGACVSNETDGLVVRIQGADFIVSTDAGEIRCSPRGRFRLADDPEESLPVVGDGVRVRLGDDAAEAAGVVVSIEPRRTRFVRTDPSGRRRYRLIGANLDRVLVVLAARDPAFNARLLDRMIVAAECGGMEPVIVVNKIDLVAGEDAPPPAVYAEMGYTVIRCSARTGEGIEEIRGIVHDGESILAGPSGSGKTSIVAALEPGLELRVGHVSERTGKGRHTTTHFELHPLSGGGWLGDTPGIREFGIWGVSQRTLGEFFRDFEPFLGRCRFAGCTHSHEPGCAVKEAVAEGSISPGRHESYLRILETLPERLS